MNQNKRQKVVFLDDNITINNARAILETTYKL